MDLQYLTAGKSNRFIARELVNGVLLPLPLLIERLPLVIPSSWAFKCVQLHYGSPFGLTVTEFERLTRETQQGFVVSDADFRAFLRCDFQISDGAIEALDRGRTLLRIECLDTTQWEISTRFAELAAELEARGFKRG